MYHEKSNLRLRLEILGRIFALLFTFLCVIALIAAEFSIGVFQLKIIDYLQAKNLIDLKLYVTLVFAGLTLMVAFHAYIANFKRFEKLTKANPDNPHDSQHQ